MTNTSLAKVEKVSLPEVSSNTAQMLEVITNALGVSRDILPSDEQIAHAWNNLPRLLTRIPVELRDEGLMRMCVAVATGLFDSGINYAWNAAIIELRQKVRKFGINIIPQIIDKDFDEKKLLDLTDNDLIHLCLKLNLISEHGFFMLDQCRDIRNNFSSAHPTIGKIDEDEFVNFLNRVARFALNNEQNAQAVDIQQLIKSIQAGSFSEDQYRVWCDRIENTFDAQRDTIFGMLHGLYCDPSKSQESRVNSITVTARLKEKISSYAYSTIINRHQDYQAKGEVDRHVASRAYFQQLGLIGLLSESERHAIISSACNALMSVHNAFNNFHNEPPFAKRLMEVSEGQAIPQSAQNEFVECIITASVGNLYGTSAAADYYYKHLIQGFSPREVQIMLDLPDSNSPLSARMKAHSRCKNKFIELVKLLNSTTVPTKSKTVYDRWIKLSTI